MKNRTPSHKSTLARCIYAFKWIFLLLAINFSVVVLIKFPQDIWMYVVFILLVAYSFYIDWRLFSFLSYEIVKEWIVVQVARKKELLIRREDVLSIEKIENYPWYYGYGSKFSTLRSEVFFTLSNQNLVRVVTKKSKTFILSPKDHDFFNNFL